MSIYALLISNYLKKIKVHIIIPYLELIVAGLTVFISGILAIVLSGYKSQLFFSIVTGTMAGVLSSLLFWYMSIRNKIYYGLRAIPRMVDRLRLYLKMYNEGIIDFTTFEEQLWEFQTELYLYYNGNYKSYMNKQIINIFEENGYLLRIGIDYQKESVNAFELDELLKAFYTDVMNYLATKDWVWYH